MFFLSNGFRRRFPVGLAGVLAWSLFCGTAWGGDFSLGIDAPSVRRSATRGEQCLNGLWRFFPTAETGPLADAPPPTGAGWGYFKVPGVWPQGAGNTNSFQPLLTPERMKDAAKWHTAWYRRELVVPEDLGARRVFLDVEHIQTRGMVYLDGKKVGEIVFPGGSVDLTGHVRPGTRQTLDLRVSAVPLSENHYEVMDGDRVYQVAAKVPNKGIVGDVFLRIVPEERIEAAQYVAKVRGGKALTVVAEPVGLRPGERYGLSVELFDAAGTPVKTFAAPAFTDADAKDGRIVFSAPWEEAALWDLHTPGNLYTATLALTRGGQTVDATLPERFGFREFAIDGRNYLLNGTVIHLRAYHLPNYSAAWMPDKASKEVSREAFRRLRELGFNFTISRNYNFREGAANYLRGHCEAADEFGHLHSLSLPHPTQFPGGLADSPENREAYAKMAGYLVRKYWNHPSLVLWVANHNHAGAWGDQNPLRLGGDYRPADAEGERKSKEAGRNNFFAAQKIVAAVDASRPLYSHASGSLGGQYSLNAYFNWAPAQERDDWLEWFDANGKYPLSFMEWGLPHIASFSSYRWPKFIWAAEDQQTAWDAEYAADLHGDRVAEWTPERLPLLDRLVELGDKPFRWARISGLVQKLPEVVRVQADYFRTNLPSLRAWGIGILLPWDEQAFYEPVPGAPPHRAKENPARLRDLNRPGLVPDFHNWGDYTLTAHPENTRLSVLGETVKAWSQPRIAWIGGGETFTTKEHVYRAGDTVAKTLVVLNDTRETVECAYEFWIRGVNAPARRGAVTIVPGAKALVPVTTTLPAALKPGRHRLAANFRFNDSHRLSDTFELEVVPPLESAKGDGRALWLYDPKGDTAKELDRLGVAYRRTDARALPPATDALVVGRSALAGPDAFLNLDAVRDGLNVLVLEQETDTLKRLGFRYQEYGLRRLFPRLPDHPALAGLTEPLLRDWRGEGTLLPPYLDYMQFFVPKWNWCGFENTRIWRCRNRGVVANVLMEKPTAGGFTPLADGGFALQYAPLLEYAEGRGRVVFCQAETVGRTAAEPAAEMLLTNLVRHIRQAPAPRRASHAVIAGAPFRELLGALRLEGAVPDPEAADVLLVGTGAESYPDLQRLAEAGKTVLVFGWDAASLRKAFPETAAEDVKAATSTLLPETPSPLLAGINHLDASFQTRLDYARVDGYEIAAKSMGKGMVLFVGVTPDRLDYEKEFRLRSSYRRRAFLVAQTIRNAGVPSASPLLSRFKAAAPETPWLDTYYLQTPIAGDDPYRYYHW